MFDVSVERHGPIFDGRAELAAERYCVDVSDTIAQEAYDRIQRRLPEVFKYLHGRAPVPKDPGRYQASIHIERMDTERVVTDSGIVYGPWLEGIGSRNMTTRFKGYHTFRRIADEIDLEAEGIAERILHDHGYLLEMGGD
jgi:hypothetical protein